VATKYRGTARKVIHVCNPIKMFF